MAGRLYVSKTDTLPILSIKLENPPHLVLANPFKVVSRLMYKLHWVYEILCLSIGI